MNFITFSRQLGSNGGEIAKRVADSLGYRFIDSPAIERAAEEMGFLDSVVKIDEKAPSFFQKFFSHKPSINLDRLNSVIYQLAEQGDAVFLGRGGQVLLKSFDCALHVRIIASRQRRAENLVERGYAREAAIKALEQSDHERGGFIKFAFGVDWDDSLLYDIVINTEKLNVDLAVNTILSLARSDDMKSCTLNAMTSLGNLALAHRAEAALIESGVSYGQATAVSVSVDKPGKIRLTGVVEDERSKARAEAVIKGVKGVDAVENAIRVMPADRHA